MDHQSRVNFIINTLFFITVFVVIYFCVNYVFVWFLPFIIGLLIAFCLKPVIEFLSKRLPFPKKFCAILSILLVFSLLGVLLWFAGTRLLVEAGDLFAQFPEIYSSSLGPAVGKISDLLLNGMAKLFPSAADATLRLLTAISESFESIILSLSASAAATITEIVKDVPSMLVTLGFSIVATFFISMDYLNIVSFLARQIPERHRTLLFDIKDFLVHTVLKMIKAYLILMFITFAELSVGFLIIRLDYAIPLAALIALLDLLPVIGTGGIMVPWIIVELIRQDYQLALGLSVIYLIVTVIRNIIEPKIVGDQIGLHPVLSLVAIYFGLKTMGVLGMILMPILAILLKWLCDKEHLKLYQH
ncbi:sporulation integral membrane protein YtvI [Zongyangia hominis]|uniref:Sporulation integral membrane protein YtvI n=1 Tax=Zongyangia hominis TaxID=2763677 RepID=A0A926EC03_9FIRM|nr:sporulation integral membrane protein YtvI [Zongyangia hominis]MBC8569454.1 sporulation integral membrane protein YtvI [Zongyangia hominis]